MVRVSGEKLTPIFTRRLPCVSRETSVLLINLRQGLVRGSPVFEFHHAHRIVIAHHGIHSPGGCFELGLNLDS